MLPQARLWILSALLVGGNAAALWAQTGTAHSDKARELVAGPFSVHLGPFPPAEPEVRPLIGETYPEDADRDRIADGLVAEVARLRAVAQTSPIDGDRINAQNELASLADVELIFNRQVTEEQIQRFMALGGEISYLYRSVSYGWNGRIPRDQIGAIPQAMGDGLVLVNQPLQVQLHVDAATRTGRVRPIWANGFAGSTGGFSGNSSITIAIVDSGVDESHTDLNGRRVYWRDFSTDNSLSPIDQIAHGSHVAGIATGSGAAGGAAAGTLSFSDSGSLSGVTSGSFFPSPLDLPATSVNFNMTARWTGGGSTTLHLASHVKPGGDWGSHGSISGTSPLTLNLTLIGDATRAYSPALLAASGVSDYVTTGQVSSYPAVGDGFNKLRGVSPGCNWAGAKVFANSGSGNTTWSHAALDDLVATRVANQIKVINMSLGVIGNPGIDATWRQKVNTTVNNGIVVVASAGNDGAASNSGAREVDDPGRAAMALTVAAANDVNQLTGYTSVGFTSPDSVPGQEEDYKPDVMAPGGSVGTYTAISSVDSNNGDGSSFTDQQANDYIGFQGTSMASPFAAGCAALVIDAMQQSGTNWDFNSSQHSRFVKMVLCATATESNADREDGNRNPSLQRTANGPNFYPSGKDRHEGYGMLNPDAAVEAVSTRLAGLTVRTLGPGAMDRRAWATRVTLIGGQAFQVNLTVPGTGDFDLYLYSSTPSAYGTPVRLASSTQTDNGVNETFSYTSSSNTTGLLVVKRISGSGTFSLIAPMSIAGTLRYAPSNYPPVNPSSKTVEGATISLSADTNLTTVTLGNGSFGMAGVAGGGTYGVTASKTNDSTPANGVSTLDIALIRQHILSPSNTSLTTPYKLLAADVNGSSTISTLDIALIRQVILGAATQFPAGLWRFAPADHVFSDANAPWTAPATKWRTNLTGSVTGEDFVAIKLGDVNDSWTMPVGMGSPAPPGNDGVSAASLTPPIRFHLGKHMARRSEKVPVPVTVSDFQEVTTTQFTLAWDPAVLRFDGLGEYGLSGLSAGNFGVTRAAEGKLAFSWNASGAAGATVAGGTAIFIVTFEVVGPVGSVSALRLTDVPTPREASVNLAVGAVAAEEGEVRALAPNGLWLGEPALREGIFQLSVGTEAGRRYVLEFADQLPAEHWTALPAMDGNGQALILTDPSATNHQRFYRVRLE